MKEHNTIISKISNSYYNEIRNKNIFAKNISKIIEKNTDKYDIYNATFTFQNIKANYAFEDYVVYFKYLFQKLSNALIINSRAAKKAPILILIPEENPSTHFHGFLLTHKETSGRFENRCEMSRHIDENNRIHIRLLQNIIDPYPKKKKFEALNATTLDKFNRKFPVLSDYRIYPMQTIEDIQRCAGYSCKNFVYSKFSYDDLIIEKR